MKRSIARLPIVEQPNKWLGNDVHGVWERGQYRCCYLTIRRLNDGKFKALLGATSDTSYPDMPLPECGYFAFDTFKEAEQHLYNYVDYVRDFRDKQFILDLHNRLHRMNPSVFPK
jgi:hypothetical protein